MPQGGASRRPTLTVPTKAKHVKPNQKQPKKYKKHRDPVKAFLIKKAEACAMERALKDPMKGNIRTFKPTEEKAKLAQVRTKEGIKKAAEKRNNQ
ncbi:hypothetical protein TVAG_395540 [Trichomonas vaginalis G3]|uniref:Uncharacterized protein n=1 Tax=Trichomonas vaginalis (strain ATCC PRA-98 / G3) TaxID=412133 RepID=A2F1E3_TRIV3|nr:hypothetical protein TVAGG3_0089110 [Trichomonas vaginalis G3]XP_001330175.1 hypothetical protein TVAGG3_0075690 [Trichomonas vaginalis G3]EAX93034.1 hypothetical protein TVAG_255150 [Trichomonas vaginalis G3]EAY01307.1 hypothetical protein TVAG_395540 [Trichomonas vaginalis G3]KAI5542837.1 hypothetical protein TVAGG3_0075690 [Trichomonas vaginalis G3]KAI5543780.1 hypothetical protein TVAGG3_0089110 [Trichomonas vaginalis G3]|eukprot:XP_001305964.1 hypothetical protein [Trichomonas vaginalis G3]